MKKNNANNKKLMNYYLKIVGKYLLVAIMLSPIILNLGYGFVYYRMNPDWEAIWLTWNGDPSHSIVINWRWDYTGQAFVMYWNETMINTKYITAQKINHVVLYGLSPATKYYYVIGYSELGTPKNWSDVYFFITAPKYPTKFKVLVQSDTHAPGYGAFGRFVEAASKEDFDFTIHCGDLVDRSFEEYWADFFVRESKFLKYKPIMPTLGNHEIYYGNASLYYEFFSLPNKEAGERWYYFRYSNALFISLYVADYKNFVITTEEENMLRTAIEWAKEQGLWTIVYFHIAPIRVFPGASNKDIEGKLFEILNETKPDLVLSGHYHGYARKTISGVTYVIVGTAGGISDIMLLDTKVDAFSFENGYLMLSFNGDTLKGYFKTLRGEIVDVFNIIKSS